MAIPDFQSIMLPLLKFAASRGGGDISTADAYKAMVDHFKVSPAEEDQWMPSRRGKTFRNRVAWAKQYLGYANLIVSVRRGAYRVTEPGRQWAKDRTAGLKLADFKAIPGYEERVHGNAVEPTQAETIDAASISTPDERIEAADAELRQRTIAILLERIGQKPPAFLEQLVVSLMSKLGYGDGSPESMMHTGGSHDGGIDGKIKMDVLGMDHISLQAKCYEPTKTVGREAVAAFAGSVAGAKGVFVTTATFTKQAIDFVREKHKNVVLVDGQRLGELMLRCGLGVNEKRTYRVFDLNEDFFAEDE
jgi:restriction system protein